MRFIWIKPKPAWVKARESRLLADAMARFILNNAAGRRALVRKEKG